MKLDLPNNSVLKELRLTAFKSYRNATLPIDDFTLIIGRNGSGKSNALDALWVLSRLVSGDDIREALDGNREGSSVRGGVYGCTPFGEASFSLGCTIWTNSGTVEFDVTISRATTLVIHERLALNGEEVLVTEAPDPNSSDIGARWVNGKQGPNPAVPFRASRLLITQVMSRIPVSPSGERIHEAASQIVATLKGVFVLDPVPSEMRNYVNGRDHLLRRDSSNLSAAIADLLKTPSNKDRLLRSMNELNEQEVIDLVVYPSQLGDVLLAVKERTLTGGIADVSAQLLSDGTLRFLAVLTALMQSEEFDDSLRSDEPQAKNQIVLEELENGLHASQAHTLVESIRESIKSGGVRVLTTAHSPVVLDALLKEEHRSVIVCQRGQDGRSTLQRLVDLDGYLRIATMSSLGVAAVRDSIRSRPELTTTEGLDFLDGLLGKAS